MSFDFRTLCGLEHDRPAQRIAAVLMPLGAVGALLPWTLQLGAVVQIVARRPDTTTPFS